MRNIFTRYQERNILERARIASRKKKKKERRKVDRFNVKRREHVNKSKERNCINVITT